MKGEGLTAILAASRMALIGSEKALVRSGVGEGSWV